MKIKWFSIPMEKTIIGITAVCSLVLMTACKSSHPEENEDDTKKFSMTDSLYKKATFDTVKSEAVLNELILSGKITFNEDKVARVYSLASGHVSDVKASLGDYVEAGQMLAEIQSTDMAGVSNDLSAAQSDLAIAKKNLEAAEDMHKSGLLSEQEYTEKQQDYQKALASLNKSKQVMSIYGRSSSNENTAGYIIKAPISGFIVEKNVTPGTEVRPDESTNLFTISDLKDVWAVANEYETDIAKVQPGYDAKVTTLSYGDKEFSGKIDKVGNILNPETKVLNLKIRLQNPDYLLKPGMFARITVHYPENRKMLSIPSVSIIFDENKTYVVLYKGKNDVRMQQVTVYKSLNGRSYILDGGVKENDVIITQYGLYIFTALKKQ
jgi:cobalt-zinc-cadmium efflux system membrane fusion protein